MTTIIHPTSYIAGDAEIGDGTKIWIGCQVREGARIGRDCVLGKGAYVGEGVVIGDCVHVQNYVSIYRGVTLEDGVFCGPHCVFTNDLHPRSIRSDGEPRTRDDWELVETLMKRGASIGANAVVLCGVTVGEWAMVGAGAVVTRDVPDYGLVRGNPARLVGYVDEEGRRA